MNATKNPVYISGPSLTIVSLANPAIRPAQFHTPEPISEKEQIALDFKLVEDMCGDFLMKGADDWFAGNLRESHEFCGKCTFPKLLKQPCYVCGQIKEVLSHMTDLMGHDERIQRLAVTPGAIVKYKQEARATIINAWYDEWMAIFMGAEALLDCVAAEGVAALVDRVGADMTDFAASLQTKAA